MAILNPNSETYKSPFIIYKRNNKLNTSSLPVFLNEEDKRNCFIFDADNRSILACTLQSDNTVQFEQLSGHTLYIGDNNTAIQQDSLLHGERFNDYEHNMPLGIYSFTAGYGTVANNPFETAFGSFNISEKDSKQLFSIGNGNSDSNRSNVVTVYKDNVIISSDLSVYGSINNSDINNALDSVNNIKKYVGDSNDKIKELEREVTDLKSTLVEYETVINKLIDNLNIITDALSDKTLLYDIPQNIKEQILINSLNPTKTYIGDNNTLVQYTDNKSNKTSFVVS